METELLAVCKKVVDYCYSRGEYNSQPLSDHDCIDESPDAWWAILAEIENLLDRATEPCDK